MTGVIRAATMADVDALLALWKRGGLDHDELTDRAEIEKKLDFDGDLFLVLDGPNQGELVASVMGTYDGHRGRVKRCVVDPQAQGQGLGRRLIEHLEAIFLDRGVTELRLEVWASNQGGLAFWSSMGWQLEPEIRYFTRSLGATS